MSEIDYSKYNIEQLRSTLSGIDRTMYPEKVRELETYLEQRLSDPSFVIQYKAESDFFNSHVPGEIVTGVWLRLIGWSLVTSIAIGIPLILIATLILKMIGVDPSTMSIVLKVFYWIVCLSFSWLFLQKILGGKIGCYELVFVKKENK